MAAPSISFIDRDAYETLAEQTLTDAEWDRIELMVKATAAIMERFCNRPLLARWWSYDPTDDEEEVIVSSSPSGEVYHYDPYMTIFDGPRTGHDLLLPTYPVLAVSELVVSGDEILEASSTTYDSSTAYYLYKDDGRIHYSQGWDYGYLKNVKVKYHAGYKENTHNEFYELQYFQYLMVQSFASRPTDNPMIISERIGNYSYKMVPPGLMKEAQGLAPEVFSGLGRFRRTPIG